jgi:hypothetical protein
VVQWGAVAWAVAVFVMVWRLAARRRAGLAAVTLVAGLAAVALRRPLLFGLQQAGADQIFERQGFDLFTHVATAWRAAGAIAIRIEPLTLALALAALAAGALLLAALRRLTGRDLAITAPPFMLLVVVLTLAGLAEIGAALVLPLRPPYEPPPRAASGKQPAPALRQDIGLTLVIADDLALLHMGLDGYFRDTTPRLQALLRSDEGLLAFHQVLSTHSQTTPSLAAMLTLPGQVPLFEALAGAGRRPLLLGDLDLPKLQGLLAPTIAAGSSDGAGTLVVLRRTAPDNGGAAVDDLFAGRDRRAILGNAPATVASIEAYDRAVRAIDAGWAADLAAAAADANPRITVLTAAHGSAVAVGRGHDPFHATLDMRRVPLFIHFNAAARAAMPETFAAYRRLAAADPVVSLADLPATLLHLLARAPGGTPPLAAHGDGLRSPDLRPARESLPDSPRHTEMSDDDVGLTYLGGRLAAGDTRRLCAHRSDTLMRARRGAMLADCLEMDVVAGPGAALHVYHPPTANTGLGLAELLAFADARHKALWLDIKAITGEAGCSALVAALAARPVNAAPVLVEFPEQSHALPDLMACAPRLRALGLPISYYLTTRMTRRCAEAVTAGAAFAADSNCQALQADAAVARATGAFTDLSFDYRGLAAVQALPEAKGLRWNTWYITPAEARADTSSPFRNLIYGKDRLNDH